MRNIREILRQKWSLNRSHREVAASLNISIGGVCYTFAEATMTQRSADLRIENEQGRRGVVAQAST